MNRREFIAGLGSAAAWPVVASAAEDDIKRVGVLINGPGTDPATQSYLAVFVQSLKTLGWNDGRNVRFEVLPSDDPDAIRRYSAALIALKPDVILASTSFTLPILQPLSNTIPIIFTQISDPVGLGLVASLARPGGNITGFTNFEATVAGKWLELLKDIAPRITRVAVILHPDTLGNEVFVRAIEAASRSLGVPMIVSAVRDAAELEHAIIDIGNEPDSALIVLPNLVTVARREAIAGLTIQRRLPTIFAYRYFVSSGGLISYGVDETDLYRRAASYVDRILRGARPADLPVQQPTRFELVINLKTAKALGVTIPETLLATADEVIQ
jgi:putative tryptophan/tyrosine transport system substrate-binding protein